MVTPWNICQCMEISDGVHFRPFCPNTELSFARSHKTHPGEKAIYFEDFQQGKNWKQPLSWMFLDPEIPGLDWSAEKWIYKYIYIYTCQEFIQGDWVELLKSEVCRRLSGNSNSAFRVISRPELNCDDKKTGSWWGGQNAKIPKMPKYHRGQNI